MCKRANCDIAQTAISIIDFYSENSVYPPKNGNITSKSTLGHSKKFSQFSSLDPSK